MSCANPNCNCPTSGKSKYCIEHKKEAYKNWREMITQKAEEKEERNIKFQELWEKACQAGVEEVGKAELRMVTVSGLSPFPICGFAWVKVYPGNCAFANWLRKNGHGETNDFGGGLSIWISQYNQSCDLKYAYAKGMAKVFADAGIKAYAESRLD